MVIEGSKKVAGRSVSGSLSKRIMYTDLHLKVLKVR